MVKELSDEDSTLLVSSSSIAIVDAIAVTILPLHI